MKRVLVAVLVAGLLACGGVSTPRARLKVLTSGADTSCSTLFNFCYTAKCSIENAGDAAGAAEVTFTLTQGDGSAIRATEWTNVGAGGIEIVEHKFSEATLSASENSTLRCVVNEIEGGMHEE